MPTLDPTEAFEQLKNQTTSEIAKIFPLQGGQNKVELEDVWVEDNKDLDDIEGQLDTKLKGRTWSVPIRAKLALKDGEGNVKDRRTMTLTQLPKITSRYSNIVEGNEYQVDHQFRLKSGIFPRIQASGDISAQVNAMLGAKTSDGADPWSRTIFDVKFQPKTRQMSLAFRDSNVPLRPVIAALGGASNDELRNAWGKAVFDANVAKSKPGEEEKQLRKLYKATTKKTAAGMDLAALQAHTRSLFADMEVDPKVTKKTIGTPTKVVDAKALLLSGQQLVQISKGLVEPADRDSLEFKDLLSAGDLIAERLRHSRKAIHRQAGNNIDRRDKLNQIIVPNMFRKPVLSFFNESSLANIADQTNPLGMLSGQLQTTVMGKGGVASEQQIMDEMKLINPSTLGFLDPIATPESKRTGITLSLPLGVDVQEGTLRTTVFDTKKGKHVRITPAEMLDSVVTFPDQVKTEGGRVVTKGGKALPLSEEVKVSDIGGDFTKKPFSSVDYILPNAKAMFAPAVNLLPFLPNIQGNRATMAAKQIQQAISLKNREAPLVQTLSTTVGGKDVSFEEVFGSFASHASPVAGVVEKVSKGVIQIKDAGGREHKVATYDNFPLNDTQAVIDATPIVKPGEKVKAGQVIADTNFSKDGVLALGTNLRVGYFPYKGLNFEDAVVASESAAKKLTSEHLHRTDLRRDDNVRVGVKSLRAYHPTALTKEQEQHLDSKGVIKPGERVRPGDVLIAAVRERQMNTEEKILHGLNRSLANPYTNASVIWDKDYEGTVARVIQHGKDIGVHVKTEEPAQIGDKIVGRSGNKGILSAIIPDKEMPHTKDGMPVQIIMSPSTVPSRINPGQLLETAAGKLAKKRGSRYLVDNFRGAKHDYSQEVTKALKDAGVPDTEEIIDPQTGKALGKAFVGDQYMLKLKHQARKKLTARSGGAEMPYDSDFAPGKGYPKSAQAIDALSVYSLISAGARKNLREMATWKAGGASKQNNVDFWSALQAGIALPAPKSTFAFDKFQGLVKGLGVDVQRQGNSLQLVPFTDKQVRNMSSWAVKDPGKMVIAKNFRPEKDGLFSPRLGGIEGRRWGHIELTEAMPNPVFEQPIKELLGLTGKRFDGIIKGEEAIEGKLGGQGIGVLLDRVDIKGDLATAKSALKTARRTQRDKLNKKVKYLRALDEAGLTAREAYMQKAVPVLPPIMRPIVQKQTGQMEYEDINNIYKAVGLTNSRMALHDPTRMPDEENNEVRAQLYDDLKSLAGLGGTLNLRDPKQRGHRGIIQQLSGKRPGPKPVGQPKSGFFQRKLFRRQQDLSMRSIIIPEPGMGLDEIGIPRKGAMELYKPFAVRALKGRGLTVKKARDAIKENRPEAIRALEMVVEDRPLLVKRDPALHKYSIQAYKPRLVEGKAIRLHPLACAGHNADFDGDTMSAYVPVSEEAVKEARGMFPSANIFSPAHGKVMYAPSQDMILGLNMMTKWGKDGKASFSTKAAALSALKSGQIQNTDVITVAGQKTTLGRMAIASVVGKAEAGKVGIKEAAVGRTEQILTDPKWRAGKDTIGKILADVGKRDPEAFAELANSLKDLGNQQAYEGMASFKLSDLAVNKKLRDPIIAVGHGAEKKIRLSTRKGPERDRKIVASWVGVAKKLDVVMGDDADKRENLFRIMQRSGSRGKWDQVKQIVSAPVVVVDGLGRPVPTPITKSFSEGLDVADYWTHLHGARRGAVQRAKETEKPGALSKQLLGTVIGNTVTTPDCGTRSGILLSGDDPDIHDRLLAKDQKVGGWTLSAGTLVTPEISEISRRSGEKLIVRSPLTCEHGNGMCAKCFGLGVDGNLPALGTNLGSIAGQAIGEPATQLAMQGMHTGAVIKSRKGVFDKFQRLEDLLSMPQKLKNAATLSGQGGHIEKLVKDPVGGWDVTVGGQKHYVPQGLGLAEGVKTGTTVKRGQMLSGGVINPHDLLEVSGMPAVRNYLTEEIKGIYGDAILRRNAEVVVRSLTDLTTVSNAGDSNRFLRGDRASTSAILAENRNLAATGKAKIRHTPLLAGIRMAPLKASEDWIARMNHSRLKDTILEAAAKGWKAQIHSPNPITPYVFGAEFGMGERGEY